MVSFPKVVLCAVLSLTVQSSFGTQTPDDDDLMKSTYTQDTTENIFAQLIKDMLQVEEIKSAVELDQARLLEGRIERILSDWTHIRRLDRGRLCEPSPIKKKLAEYTGAVENNLSDFLCVLDSLIEAIHQSMDRIIVGLSAQK